MFFTKTDLLKAGLLEKKLRKCTNPQERSDLSNEIALIISEAKSHYSKRSISIVERLFPGFPYKPRYRKELRIAQTVRSYAAIQARRIAQTVRDSLFSNLNHNMMEML